MSKKTTAKKATTEAVETTPKSEAHTGNEHLDFSAGNPAAGEAREKARAQRPAPRSACRVPALSSRADRRTDARLTVSQASRSG